jgi:hypothetical protein
MQKKRPWLSLVIAGATALGATVAVAAGFGPTGSGAVLGQPLDFAVLVRLDAGEPLAPECVAAEVTVGERRLMPAVVRTSVEAAGIDSARVRVVTTQSIDEPVVGIQLSAGCNGRISRRFVVFADPPVITPLAAVPAFAANPPEAVPAAATAGAAPAAPADTPPMPALSARPGTEGSAANTPPRRRAERRTDDRQSDRQSDRRNKADRKTAAAPNAEVPRRARRTLAAVPAVDAAPRLKLEAAEVTPRAEALAVEQALEAVAEAASAARATAAAASAAQERIAALERSVGELRGEAKASRDLVAQWRQSMGRAEDAGRWLWPLLGAVLLLAGLAAWLAMRLAAAQRERQRLWAQAAAAAGPRAPVSEITPSRQPTRPIPFVTSELRPSDPAGQRARAPAPAWPPPAPTEPWQPPSPSTIGETTHVLTRAEAPTEDLANERTDILPAQLRADDTAPRDVSIEELIDLEQQAEFFVVLGQDDAAIELLVEHLRNTGGGSPLPYLKLLEIYRRRGDRADYERMRARFNHRFNAYAPDWGVDLQAGRTLEDYSGVIPRLQQVWGRPLDAMAEMEALLFRKSRGELFDLPAYREVLFLYSLARDLLDREAADGGDVDLLLPMADGGEFSSTAPAPFLGLAQSAASELHGFDDRPTAPVDFDLTTDVDRPTSIFDPLEEPDTRPGRR